MPKKQPQRDPIATHRRTSVAAQRIGINAKCTCGESRPQALVVGTTPIVCFACKRKKQGRSITDNHHPAGKANNPVTIPIAVNDHRAVLSPAQYEWPKSTLENSHGSPLISAAAGIRGFRDTALYLIEVLLCGTPDFLEELDQFLTDKLGARWWTHTELDRFSPKR
jgi:hypothetical protein